MSKFEEKKDMLDTDPETEGRDRPEYVDGIEKEAITKTISGKSSGSTGKSIGSPGGSIIVTPDYVQFPSVNTDPGLAEGRTWYRSDLDRLQYAIGTTAADKRQIPYGTIDVDAHAGRHGPGGPDQIFDQNLNTSNNVSFAQVTVSDLNLKSRKGNWTLIEGKNSIVARNNSTGEKYTLKMEKVD